MINGQENNAVIDFTKDQSRFINKVYGWMSLALLLTTVVAFFVASEPSILQAIATNRILFFGLIIAEIGLVIYISARIQKISVQQALLFFLLYSVLNGVTLALIFLIYTSESIATTFGITALTFGVMSLYGYYTKKDLTAFGNILVMALVGIVIASIVNIFLRSEIIYWIVSYAGVIIFTGLVAYDTQKIKRMGENLTEGEEIVSKMAILGALTLYLDFINLFLFLLRILGNRR